MLGGRVDAATLVAALGAGPPPPTRAEHPSDHFRSFSGGCGRQAAEPRAHPRAPPALWPLLPRHPLHRTRRRRQSRLPGTAPNPAARGRALQPTRPLAPRGGAQDDARHAPSQRRAGRLSRGAALRGGGGARGAQVVCCRQSPHLAPRRAGGGGRRPHPGAGAAPPAHRHRRFAPRGCGSRAHAGLGETVVRRAFFLVQPAPSFPPSVHLLDSFADTDTPSSCCACSPFGLTRVTESQGLLARVAPGKGLYSLRFASSVSSENRLAARREKTYSQGQRQGKMEGVSRGARSVKGVITRPSVACLCCGGIQTTYGIRTRPGGGRGCMHVCPSILLGARAWSVSRAALLLLRGVCSCSCACAAVCVLVCLCFCVVVV